MLYHYGQGVAVDLDEAARLVSLGSRGRDGSMPCFRSARLYESKADDLSKA